MMVAIPGEDGEGDETTAASDAGWGAGPLGLMGVTTGRYPAPQPSTITAIKSARPAYAGNTRARPKYFGKRLIQFGSCLLVDCK
jgi:hypothetical protein